MESLETDITFADSTIEQLTFADNDASVSVFLSDGLPGEAPRSMAGETPSGAESGLPPSSLVLGEDQSSLGANLQIGLNLDLPTITHSADNIFDPGTEPFTSLAVTTSCSEIMGDNTTFSGLSQTHHPPVPHVSYSDAVQGDVCLQSTASIANMNLAIHNYAETISEKKDSPVTTFSSLNPQQLIPNIQTTCNVQPARLPPAKVEIKTVDQNSQPNMLLLHDKASGKNILLPIANPPNATKTQIKVNQQPSPQQDPSLMGTITINVGDFLNILNQAGKGTSVLQTAQQVPTVENPASAPITGLSTILQAQSTSPSYTNLGANISTPGQDSHAVVTETEVVLPVTQQEVESIQVTTSEVYNEHINLAQNVETLPVSGSIISAETPTVSSQIAMESTHLKDFDLNQQINIVDNLQEGLTEQPADLSNAAIVEPLDDQIISKAISVKSATGAKRIRKPTPKQEQLQEERQAKENSETTPTKPRRARKQKTKGDGPSPDKERVTYIKAGASSVARVLDTGGQGAFMEKLDVSVHVDESQCIVLDGQKRWKCLLCPKVYSSKHNLITHILDHSGIKPHCCMICGKHFKQASHLQTHMLTHGNLKPHSCTICNRSFSQASHVKRHMAIHMEKKPHMCHICDRGFAFPSELKAHLEKHVNGKENACDECEATFDSLKKLKAHKATEHTSTDLTCKECGKQYTYPSQLRDHMMKHEGKRPYICGECGMDFMKEHHLKAHQFTHTGLKPFVCTECGRGFNQKANLQRHILIHEETPKFKCDICSRTFTQPQILKSHLMTHDEKKPYQCKVCGKDFSRLHNLNGHMHMHNGEKPHICHLCGASFTLKGNLNRHKKDKHNLDGNTECTEEEAAQILNEMSGKKISDSETPDACDDSPAPKKKRKSFPRKTVTEEDGGEMEKEIEAAWQKADSPEDGEDNPQELLNQILSGTVPGVGDEVPVKGGPGQEVRAVSFGENPDGSTEWIAYIPLTGEEGLQTGTTITLVPSDQSVAATGSTGAEVNVSNLNSNSSADSTVSGRGRKRKPTNFGDNFMISGPQDQQTGTKKTKRGKNKASHTSLETADLPKSSRGKSVKKASLASVLATKLKSQS